jgi:flagellar motor switch protein FliM
VSEPVLNQAEIDALIDAIRDGRVPTGKGSLVPLQHAAPLNLRDPAWNEDRIIRRRLPVLDLVFDRLVPAMQVTLTKSLRFPVRAERGRLELYKFGDFHSRFAGRPALFEVMRLDPLRGLSAMVLDGAILYALVDALMGGLGVAEPPGDREVSDIEESLLHRPHLDLLRDFEGAWKPWFPLRVEHVRCDRAVQALSTIREEEICHVGTITVAADALPASPIHFVMPYSSLEPLLEATSSRAGEEMDPNWRVNLVRNLRRTRAQLSAVVGEAQTTAGAVRRLRAGDVIRLDRRVDEEIDVYVEGRPVYRARMGQSHLNYAVRITQRRQSAGALQDRTAGQILVRKGLITREQLAVALVDEHINRRPFLDSIAARGWVERRLLDAALHNS